MRIGKIVSSAEYRMDERFQNWKFFSPSCSFQINKNLEIY